MLTPEEQADLDFLYKMADTDPSNLTDEDWDLAEELEKKAKGFTGKKSPEEIKARGEEAYRQMMRDIEKAQVAESYPTLFTNPYAQFATSLVAPSSIESISSGKMPTWGDIGFDAATGLASLALAPEKIALAVGKAAPKVGRLLAPTASRTKNVVAGAIEQGALAGGGEAIQSAMHDRDYNLLSPIAGAGMGGVVGGITTTPIAKRLADAGYTEAEIPSVMGRLGSTKEGSIRALGRRDLSDVGKETVDLGMFFPGESVDISTPVKANEILKTIDEEIEDLSFKLDVIPMRSYEKQMSELSKLKDDIVTRQRLGDESWAKAFPQAPSAPVIAVPMTGVLQDINTTISNPSTRTKLLEDLARRGGKSGEVKGALERARYQKLLAETPDIVTEGTILGTAKNMTKAPPHIVKSGRTLLQPPTQTATRSQATMKPAQYDADGNLIYAPRGRITLADLWADADRISKNKNK